MAHHKSCIKRIKTSAKANERNRSYRSRMKTAIKKVRGAETVETAVSEYKSASSLLDKMVNKKIIHSNNAANKKSRLQKHIAGMTA